jgi:hypothetical protein
VKFGKGLCPKSGAAGEQIAGTKSEHTKSHFVCSVLNVVAKSISLRIALNKFI